MKNGDTLVVDRLLDSLGRCLTPETARAIAGLRASPELQARAEELADKNTEGKLTPAERDEHESFVLLGHFIAMLNLKARALLREEREAWPEAQEGAFAKVWKNSEDAVYDDL